ncbi:MAG: sigma-70 family RNA polymerase sigma factor, partial [Firmicutes bacterium]|nr:sigma-70 family RNA polymerase sigma factor [Bacillota bacterium]
WNAIPPARPGRLGAFLVKITRNLALKKAEYLNAAKRRNSLNESLEELSECVESDATVETEAERRRIEGAINSFLEHLTAEKQKFFVWRYWYFYSVEEICRRTGYSTSKVKSMLFRLRGELRDYLEKEGIEI